MATVKVEAHPQFSHRQPFAPETIVCARRRPNGRKARARRRATRATATDPTLNDRLDDLVFAG
jgi:hypothetical protein